MKNKTEQYIWMEQQLGQRKYHLKEKVSSRLQLHKQQMFILRYKNNSNQHNLVKRIQFLIMMWFQLHNLSKEECCCEVNMP